MDTAATSADPAQVEVTTAPPEATKNGVAMMGKYPLNRRLRAEALVEAKVKTDPDGLVDDDMIAETGARIAKAKANSPVAKSIKDLTAEVGKIDDVAHLNRLRADEVAGQNRAGAVEAIDARIGVVTAPPAN